MTYENLYRLIEDARDCPTFEDYLASCGGSYPDQDAFDNNKVAEKMEIIYNLRDNLTMRAVIETSGMTMAEFARKYDISYRTVQGWCDDSNMANHREAPRYVVYMFLSDFLSDNE